jgi:hypothetical protein
MKCESGKDGRHEVTLEFRSPILLSSSLVFNQTNSKPNNIS